VLSGEPGTQRQLAETTNSDGRGDLRVTYVPREDATPEGELAALAAVYALVIQAHERNKTAAPATMRRKE
jgi:hypothetical protein